MTTLINKFKIDLDKIKKRNLELIATKWIDTLNTEQKKYLNFRKGGTFMLNSDGSISYLDLSDYLTQSKKFYEISMDNLKKFLLVYQINYTCIYFDNIDTELKKILQQIQLRRIESIQKYIEIEDSIFKKGINSRDIVYRVQNKPFSNKIIPNSTSWSLCPIEWFCNSADSNGNNECFLYITKIPPNLKVCYIENDSKDKNLNIFNGFTIYEFEYILPRNIEFVEIKKKKIKIINFYFNKKISKNTHHFINICWIKIIKIHKNINFPQNESNVTLVSPM
jgi:hypothetical protein